MLEDDRKQAEIDVRTPAFMDHEASKPFGWRPFNYLAWATVQRILDVIELAPGASVVDIGSGSGWTTLFLSEAGYEVTGYDLVPANVELSRRRAERWGSRASFEVADMEALPAGPSVDAALCFDALHHATDPAAALRSIAERLRPGGWIVLGEPTWLHRFSRSAAWTRRNFGWQEHGFTVRELRRHLETAGFIELRRFFGPTDPYEHRLRGLAWQLTRLVATNAFVAPQGLLWFAARRAGLAQYP